MEKLTVKNFLSLRDVAMEIKPFTVLIGPQAQGKSVVARLLYVFRDTLFDGIVRTLSRADPTAEKYQDEIGRRFKQIFPPYAWKEREFEIAYQRGHFHVEVNHVANSESLQVQVGHTLTLLLERGLASTVIQPDEPDDVAVFRTYRKPELVSSLANELNGDDGALSAAYIPESRAYLSTLRRSIWSLFSSSRADDVLPLTSITLEFARLYEGAVHLYPMTTRMIRPAGEVKLIVPDILRSFEKIMAGKYELRGEEEWIVTRDRRTLLSDASSGQQEVVPLMLVLTWLCTQEQHVVKAPWWICVEEPESHLFPTAQRELIELLVRIHNRCGHRFLTTSHSPYVLTVLNNLITASAVASESPSKRSAVDKLVSRGTQISVPQIGAFLIDKGGAKSILDRKTGLIGADVIDSVSSDLASTFEKLMEISLGNQR